MKAYDDMTELEKRQHDEAERELDAAIQLALSKYVAEGMTREEAFEKMREAAERVHNTLVQQRRNDLKVGAGGKKEE